MALCGKISIGSSYDCDNPVIPGVSNRLILGNYEDVEAVTKDVEGRITNITLKSGTSAVVFEQFRQSTTPQTAFIPQNTSIGFDHQIPFSVFDISHSQKQNLERMARGKIFGIVENANRPGNSDSVFEVFGLGVGMEVQTMTRINSDLESSGAYVIDLKTSDNEGKEQVLPQSYWDTDYATTKAKIDAIVSGANLFLTTATVENAAPTDIVLTFDKSIVSASGVVASNKAVSSISGLGTSTVTVTVSSAYVNGDTITISGTFIAADGTLVLNQEPVTNNVS